MKAVLKKNPRYGLCLALALAFYLFLAFQIPYTHDDWGWGSAAGIRHLLTADINSRYAGNLLEVLLTRLPLLKGLVMGVTLAAIPAAASELALRAAGKTDGAEAAALRPLLFLGGNVLLLLTRDAVWAQTVGWVAGFSNFVFSGLLLLLFLRLLPAAAAPDAPAGGVGRTLGCFVFGVVIQLFIENLSVALFLFTLCAVVYQLASKRRVGPCLWALLLGVTVGAALMFSSGIYRTLWTTGRAIGDYRQLTVSRDAGLIGNLAGMLRRFFTGLLPQMLSWNGQFAAAAAGLLALRALCRFRSERRPAALAAGVLDLVFAAGYLYAFYLTRHAEAGVETVAHAGLFAAMDGVFVFLVLMELPLLFRGERALGLRLGLLWLAPLVILAPMLVINTVGPRSFYTSNVCLLLFCVTLAAALPLPDIRLRRAAVWLCAVCALALGLFWGRVYLSIGAVTRARDAAMAEVRAGAADSVLLPFFPHKQYLWYPNPVDAVFEKDFRAFYRIPDGTALSFAYEENAENA